MVLLSAVEEAAQEVRAGLPVVLQAVRFLVVTRAAPQVSEVPVVAGVHADLRAKVCDKSEQRGLGLGVHLVAVRVACDDEAERFGHGWKSNVLRVREQIAAEVRDHRLGLRGAIEIRHRV